jgi:hypothetical protein
MTMIVGSSLSQHSRRFGILARRHRQQRKWRLAMVVAADVACMPGGRRQRLVAWARNSGDSHFARRHHHHPAFQPSGSAIHTQCPAIRTNFERPVTLGLVNLNYRLYKGKLPRTWPGKFWSSRTSARHLHRSTGLEPYCHSQRSSRQ